MLSERARVVAVSFEFDKYSSEAGLLVQASMPELSLAQADAAQLLSLMGVSTCQGKSQVYNEKSILSRCVIKIT